MKINLPLQKARYRISDCIFHLDEVCLLEIEDPTECHFLEFELNTRNVLSEIFGEQSEILKKFDSIKFNLTSTIIGMEDYSIEQQKEDAFYEGLKRVQELLLAIQQILQSDDHQYVSQGGQMNKNQSGEINIQGHGNVINFGSGDVRNSVEIEIEKYLKSLREKVDEVDQSPEEKVEAKGILEKVISNPLLISVLTNSIPELIKVFSGQS